MAIQGPDIKSDLILDLTQFMQAANLASRQIKKTTHGMTQNVDGFATTMDKRGREISGTWWKRFGTVALGFTIAYRAMNVFENGLMRLGSQFKEAILQSGQLAEQQAKNAFWMTVFADRSVSFSDAFAQAAGAINVLREESIRSISSIDELTTGIDELAQAGVPITSTLMPKMVSLVDFTGMVAQTVGSTTRQIRQEFQALMDGTSRVTNQLVRVLTNMGVLTRDNLKDLKNMVNRAEIFEKVADAIHTRWSEMVETLIKSSPERAFAYWEKSIQKVLVQSVLLASQLRGVDNLFGETLFNAAKDFRDSFETEDMDRMVNLIGLLNDGLDFLVGLFNDSVTAIAKLVTVAGNLSRELSAVWSVLGNVAILTASIKGLQLLGKTMLWLVVGPLKALGKTVLLVFSPLILSVVAAGAAMILVLGQLSLVFGNLKAIWQGLKDTWNDLTDSVGRGLDKMSSFILPSPEGPAGGPFVRGPITDPNASKESGALSGAKDLLLKGVNQQVEAFKAGLNVLKKSTDPYVKEFMAWFDKLFLAPEVPGLSEAGEAVATAFKSTFPDLILDNIKKMEREMKNFSSETTAFLATIDALKNGLRLEDVSEYTKTQEVLAEYARVIADLNKQMSMGSGPSEIRIAEYNELLSVANAWKKSALAKLEAEFALKRYTNQLKELKSLQDEYNSLVMTGNQYQLWSLDEQIEDLRALAVGNEDLLALIEKYSIIRREAVENEFSGLRRLVEDVAQSMESSFSDLFFDVMTTNWEDLEDVATNALRGMQRALADFFAQLAKDALFGQQNGAGQFLGGILSKYLGSQSGTAGASYGFEAGGDYGWYHGGGLVGSNVPKKQMPLSLLENAVRLHSGLRGDEYPAILQRGEKVYPRGESPIESVTIINNTGVTPEVSETRNQSGGVDISILIGQMIAKDVYKGGPVSQAIKSTYGLQNHTIRR